MTPFVNQIWITFLILAIASWSAMHINVFNKYSEMLGIVALLNLLGLLSTFLYAIWSN